MHNQTLDSTRGGEQKGSLQLRRHCLDNKLHVLQLHHAAHSLPHPIAVGIRCPCSPVESAIGVRLLVSAPAVAVDNLVHLPNLSGIVFRDPLGCHMVAKLSANQRLPSPGT
jgi:hypothetical protein